MIHSFLMIPPAPALLWWRLYLMMTLLFLGPLLLYYDELITYNDLMQMSLQENNYWFVMIMGYYKWNGISTTTSISIIHTSHHYIISCNCIFYILLHSIITWEDLVIPFLPGVLLIYTTLQHRSGEGVRLGLTCAHIYARHRSHRSYLHLTGSPMRSTMVFPSPLPLLTLFRHWLSLH